MPRDYGSNDMTDRSCFSDFNLGMWTSRRWRNQIRPVQVIAFVLLLAFGAASAPAQTGGGFDLSWNTIAGGGIAQGGAFKLAMAVGQSAAGDSVTGNGFNLQPGFLQDASYFPVPVTISAFTLE